MHGVCRTAAMNLLTGVLFYNKNKMIRRYEKDVYC